MTARWLGAIIALLVVVAVGVTSLRLISFSFQEQAAADSNPTMQGRQQEDTETAQADLGKVLTARELPATRVSADQEWDREAQLKQTNLGPRQDEERSLAEARRQAEQKRQVREAQQPETDLTRRLEEQRKLAQAWMLEEQERRQRAAEQQQADLKRLQEDERRLGEVRLPVKAEPQRVEVKKEPAEPLLVRKSEGRVTTGLKVAATEATPAAAKLAPAKKREPAQASSTGERRQARLAQASVKRKSTTSPVCLFLAELTGTSQTH